MSEMPPNPEAAPKPHYILMITRHAERLPSGELSSDGVEHAKTKGEGFQDAEVIKGYASDEKSQRTVVTSNLISEASGVKSPQTGEKYNTRVVPDIQYDILKADFPDVLAEGKKAINDATVAELGLPEGTILEDLPPDQQAEVALARQNNQQIGFRIMLDNPGAVRTMATGLATQLSKEQSIAKRYDSMREQRKAPVTKDVIFNTTSHGLFIESLIIESAVMVLDDGTEIRGREIIDNPDFGGFIQPAESVGLELGEQLELPDQIPMIFYDRKIAGKLLIDKNKLVELLSLGSS